MLRPIITPPLTCIPTTVIPVISDAMQLRAVMTSAYSMTWNIAGPPIFMVPAVLRFENERRIETMTNDGRPATPPSGGADGAPPAPSAPGGIDDSGGPIEKAANAAVQALRIFTDFLGSHSADVGEIGEDGLSIADILPGRSHLIRLTRFTALDDTLVFSKLVSRLLGSLTRSVSTLIDLGAGSSIPTIKALLDHGETTALQVIAVDNDGEAIRISDQNVRAYDLQDRYTFLQSDIIDYILSIDVGEEQAISANLPYLPIPPDIDISDDQYAAVNGGPDGTRYIEQLLDHEIPSGTMIALEWSSLSNPARIIEMINKRYDVLHVIAYKAPFGTYTGSPLLLPYLLSQRDLGLSVFTTGANGNNSYYFVGTVLRRR